MSATTLEAARRIVAFHGSWANDRDTLLVARAYIKACEALEASADTKGAYIGEFKFTVIERDAHGYEHSRKVDVPWTTIKEIMAAIRARAALSCSAPPSEEGGGR